MTVEDIRKHQLIVLECISGSKAYGLNTPESDTDIKGVFLLPQPQFYGLEYIQQINNATNDIAFYELKRFLELLALNNPNILELLNTPEQFVLHKHPLLYQIQPERILSKYCFNTFGKFAYAQIKKARGLKKKILNPVGKERKSVLDFCYINYQKGAIPLLQFLALKNWKQEHCGLVNIPHMKDVFGLYYSPNENYKGIITGEKANEVCLSSIPKNAPQEALLYFNRNGYSTYCKEYREYWDWVEKRNEIRYQSTQQHGKNYDAKNMMHVFRLLDMAIEIANEQKVNVQRPNRDFLLAIKAGEYAYDDLLNMANQKQKEMEIAFQQSGLPENPDVDYINQLAFELRHELYQLPEFNVSISV